jgi:hypothetical protein
MERPAGLGRSLEDVLHALAPADPETAAPGGALFESDDVERQLDQVVVELRELNDRVEHLVALVPDAAVEPVDKVKSKRKKAHKGSKGKKKRKKPEAGKKHAGKNPPKDSDRKSTAE